MNDEFIKTQLRQALLLAQSQRGFCAPNPAVGAVITQDQRVVATGTHLGSGQPHAEIEALKLLNFTASGATLYVTLEPCCHFGKTPPCTDQIIKSGIRQVYFGLVDPNPMVAGKGVAALQRAGIRCEFINLPEIHEFYASYIYWHQQHRPWVTAKMALSLDGKIAGKNGAPVSITGVELQHYTHEKRKCSDAILTTINTIIKDDPQLNVRLQNNIIQKPIYILDSQLRLPQQSKIWQTAKNMTLLHADNVNEKRREVLIAAGVRCEPIKATPRGLDLTEVLKLIGRDGMHDLWVEVGSKCFQSFLHQQLINQALIYLAPKILGEEAVSAFTQPWQFPANARIKWLPYGAESICEITLTSMP